MQIWIVLLDFSHALSDELFQRGLQQVDSESRVRIQRFFRRQDAWRCLVGRLLPRALLKERNIPLEHIKFKYTAAGKPFIEAPDTQPTIGYNITHDNEVVAMVSRYGDKGAAAKVGIDVMKCSLPKGETVRSFLRSLEENLTQQEKATFTSELDTATALKYIFMLWTLKEAYTKAIGLGLGFDFKRIQYDIVKESVTVDGVPPIGWNFLLFVMKTEDVYQGAVASWVGGAHSRVNFVSNIENDSRFKSRELSHLIDDP